MDRGYDSFREQTLIQMVNDHQRALKNLCFMILHDAPPSVQRFMPKNVYEDWVTAENG